MYVIEVYPIIKLTSVDMKFKLTSVDMKFIWGLREIKDENIFVF